MNRLVFTLCVLIVALLTVVTVVKTERLSVEDLNPNKIVAYSASVTTTINPQPTSKPLYNYSYNTDTGIKVEESGHLNYINTDKEALEVRGSYSYTDAEGNIFNVSYIANENGFQPQVAHIHTAIKKALQYIGDYPEENGKK
ncbi:endocuticle structural glycoprotein SgAbd-3-like [Anoplolepis gracilipes]|uniref:endocuticle structural glycoprotein SgAbd-3-like n=1 Tax=Anoplolepis gracilipes TaxID=354296 RepID=UPI003BA111AF